MNNYLWDILTSRRVAYRKFDVVSLFGLSVSTEDPKQ